MATERQKQLWLGGLLIVLAVVFYRAFAGGGVVPLPAAPGTPPQAGALARRQAPSATGAPDVHLKALEAERPKPIGAERDLFRFKQKPQPAAVARPAAPTAPPVATGPPPPPPVPPIPYKFIGLAEGQGSES